MRSDELLNAIKLNSFIPISQYTLKDEDLLGFCDREMELSVIPALLQYREEYLVYEKIIPIIPNKKNYSIPYRAIGGKLRALFLSNDNGKTLIEMHRIGYDQRTDLPVGGSSSQYFFLRGNEVVLQDNPSAGQLVMSFYIKPNKLVLPQYAAFPSAIHYEKDINGNIDTSKTTLEFSSVLPEALALGKVDFLEGKAGYRTFSYDITPTSTADTRLEFNASDFPLDFSIEDYIAVAQQSIFPQIPDDLHTLLVEQVSQRALKALGDQQGYALNEAKVARYEKNMEVISSDRVESSPQKIVNRNGFLRRLGRYFNKR